MQENLLENTETINLSGAGLTVDEAKELALRLRNGTTLKTLDLSNNRQISDEAFELIVDALKVNRSLTTLNLEGCNIGDTKGEMLAEMLKINRHLIHLNLMRGLQYFSNETELSFNEALSENHLVLIDCNMYRADTQRNKLYHVYRTQIINNIKKIRDALDLQDPEIEGSLNQALSEVEKEIEKLDNLFGQSYNETPSLYREVYLLTAEVYLKFNHLYEFLDIYFNELHAELDGPLLVEFAQQILLNQLLFNAEDNRTLCLILLGVSEDTEIAKLWRFKTILQLREANDKQAMIPLNELLKVDRVVSVKELSELKPSQTEEKWIFYEDLVLSPKNPTVHIVSPGRIPDMGKLVQQFEAKKKHLLEQLRVENSIVMTVKNRVFQNNGQDFVGRLSIIKVIDIIKHRIIHFPMGVIKNSLIRRDYRQWLKDRWLNTFGFDGYDYANNRITSADGETTQYTGSSLPFWLMLASFLGLPSRPDSVIDGVPSFSFLQLLRNFIGGWNPLKETIINSSMSVSLYQYRWTEKKIWQIPLLLFKFFLILPLKIISTPFKLLVNLLKLVTEFLLPSMAYFFYLSQSRILEELTNFMLMIASIQISGSGIGLLVLKVLGVILITLTATIPLILLVGSYVLLLLCRVGFAITSPTKSAQLAFAFARNLLNRYKDSPIKNVLSNILGVFAALLSLAITALFWSLALPLVLSGLVTVFPSVLLAIQGFIQLPVVAAFLSWLSHLSWVSGSMSLVSSLFSSVGSGLSLAFGPAISALATAFSVQIPAIILTVGTTLGMIFIPAGAMLSLVADVLSDLWAKWVESGLFSKINAYFSPRPSPAEISSIALKEKLPQTDPALSDRPEKVGVYQLSEGGEYIVSKTAQHFDTEQGRALDYVLLVGKKAEQMLLRAEQGDMSRLATEQDKHSESMLYAQPAQP